MPVVVVLVLVGGKLATPGSWRPALMGMSEGKLANDSV